MPEDIGLTFPKILRSMLRQAPNILLVGEIAIWKWANGDPGRPDRSPGVHHAAHNDAPSAITRHIEWGQGDPVASAVQAIMPQRLIP